MASIANDPGGRRRILFTDVDGKRKAIRLGKVPLWMAEQTKTHVEHLLIAKRYGLAVPPETTGWLAEQPDTIAAKLLAAGLVAPRAAADSSTLAAFVDAYVAGRSDVKGSTATVFGHTRRCLVEYFGATKPLGAITPGDADDWRRWLAVQRLAENTVRRRCGIAKQFFRAAVRKRLIAENPFADMKGMSVLSNRQRDYFVSREDAGKVLDACPDSQWRLLFALSRYGGLRCPSEHLGLVWGDVDWERGRIVVRSPKTAHHEGKASRVIPLFPELRTHLQAVLDELLADFDPKAKRLSEQPIISRYRDRNTNLRTQLERIIARAGLTPWPKLFQNLRSTRETELAEQFPIHVVCEWLGNSRAVAARHYLQVTDGHFEAAQKAAQHPLATSTQGVAQESPNAGIAGECEVLRYCASVQVGDDRLELPTLSV